MKSETPFTILIHCKNIGKYLGMSPFFIFQIFTIILISQGQSGFLYEEILSYYREKGIKSEIDSIVLVDVSNVSEVTSPLYDMGISEQEIKSKWKKHFESL